MKMPDETKAFALSQATLSREMESKEDTIARAQLYYEFLRGATENG